MGLKFGVVGVGPKFGPVLKFHVGHDQTFCAVQDINSIKRSQERKLNNIIAISN